MDGLGVPNPAMVGGFRGETGLHDIEVRIGRHRGMFLYGLDYSLSRREALQAQAARAAKLAPETPAAEIALAYAQVVARQDISRLQRHLTELTEKFPNDSHLNRVLSFAGMWTRRF